MSKHASSGRWRKAISATRAVGKLAAARRCKAVLLSHLTWKADDDYSKWADEVKKNFSAQCLIAKDLKDFDRLNDRSWHEATVRKCRSASSICEYTPQLAGQRAHRG